MSTVERQIAQTYVRQNMVDQLSFDPNVGPTNVLSADGPVVLAWGRTSYSRSRSRARSHGTRERPVLPAGRRWRSMARPRSAADMLRSTVDRRPMRSCSTGTRRRINFGRGARHARISAGRLRGRDPPTELTIGLNFGEPGSASRQSPSSRSPRSRRPACPPRPSRASRPASTACPRSSCSTSTHGAWSRLPHLAGGTRYAVDRPEPLRRPDVGHASLIRFVNDRTDGVGFSGRRGR